MRVGTPARWRGAACTTRQSANGVELRLNGETLSLRTADAEARNALLLLVREHALRFCEAKGRRCAGDTQARLRVRELLAVIFPSDLSRISQ